MKVGEQAGDNMKLMQRLSLEGHCGLIVCWDGIRKTEPDAEDDRDEADREETQSSSFY